MKKNKIGFYGLTHLGLIYSIVFAKKNIQTVAFSDSKKLINQIKKNKINISEPNLENYIKSYKKNINYTNNFNDLSDCDLVFFSMDTPINNNKPDYKIIINALSKLIKTLKNKKTELIILSQVYPGFTEQLNWDKSKLFYQVETLIFGEAINRAEYPERIIIGYNQKKDFKKSNLKNVLKNFTEKIIEMDYKSAELTKIAINLFLISNINTTNMISNACEEIGASWNSIIPALKSDKRIGKYSYLQPSLSIGGTNLMRDLVTFKKIFPKENKNNKLINVWQQSNSFQKKWVFKIIDNLIKQRKINNILILGLAYKENTDSTQNSIFLEIINKYKNIKFHLFDPIVTNEIKKKNTFHMHSVQKVIKIFNKIEIVMILNKSNQFKKIFTSKIIKNLDNKYIIDPYGLLKLFNNKNYFMKGN